MYVDIHTSMFKDYDYTCNWTVKAISMKNNIRQICQLESVKVYNICNVYRIIAFSSQTNPDIFKKKKLEKKIYIYEVLKSNVHCHDAHSCETIARS